MNRYTTMFRTHQPKMHYLFTLKDIYDEWAHFHNPAYDDDLVTSLDLINYSHTEEDDYTIIPLFFYNAMTFAQYNANNPLCAWSSNANDKTKVKKLFEEYILPKYWNKFYILDLIGKCDETPNTIRAMKQAIKYAFRINDKFLIVYRNNNWMDANEYYIKIEDSTSKRRKIYCFQFDELVAHVVLLSVEERTMFGSLKRAIREQRVEYASEECYYLIEEIYKNI